MFKGDASEIYSLAADLAQVSGRAVPAIRGVMDDIGKGLADQWRQNARETSGEHGKWYPDSIDSELIPGLSSVAVDVGANTAKKQGRMGPGFEFGSVNQPPHLDGLRALEGYQERAERQMDSAIGFLFP